MSWKQTRLFAFGVTGSVLASVGTIVWVGTVEKAGLPLQVGLAGLGGLMASMVIFDVVYHARHGDGQACRHCGHLRKMRSVRVYSACPKCGA